MAAINPIKHPPTGTTRPSSPPIPEFYMPAMPPLGLLKALKRWIRGRARHA